MTYLCDARKRRRKEEEGEEGEAEEDVHNTIVRGMLPSD